MRLMKMIQMTCGQAYVVALNEDKTELLEMGDVFLPNENEKGTRPYRYEDFGEVSDLNKRVITVCTMVGCCYGCKFCSVRRTFKRMLTAEEIVAQVEFCLREGLKHGRCADFMQSKELNVLYTRMGEPCLNIDSVIRSIYTLAEAYPHVKIGLSTCGIRGGVKKLLKHPQIAKHIMMQFSAHGTDEETRQWMFGTKTGKDGLLMSLEEIAQWVHEFRKLNQRKVSLNFILLEQFDYDFMVLKKYFHQDEIYLRLSPLNVTENSIRLGMRGLLREEDVLYKKPFSNDKLRKVIASAEKAGFSYAYAPAIDEEIKNKAACGQALETLKEEMKLVTFDDDYEEIERLVKTYKDRDAKTLRTTWEIDPRNIKAAKSGMVIDNIS